MACQLVVISLRVMKKRVRRYLYLSTENRNFSMEISTENGYVSDARNSAIRCVCGEVILPPLSLHDVANACVFPASLGSC